MSRIRKLSEVTSDLSLRRLKQQRTTAKVPPVANMKIAKLSGSPYSKINKIARTPSYGFIHPLKSHGLRKSNSNSSVRLKSKEYKGSVCAEDLSFLSQISNNPWENQKIQAKKLKAKLVELENSSEYSNVWEKYSEIFSEINEKDLIFGQLLIKIKTFYEEKLSELNTKVVELVSKHESQISEKQSYIKMLERISKENIDLGKEVQHLEMICTELQSSIEEIKNISLENIPKNEENWKALLYENSQYSVLCHNMKLDIKDYQYKEDQLIKLIDALKNRGFPVDKVYEEDVRARLETDSESSKSLNTSKCQKIPTLELSKMIKSSDSSFQ